MDSKFRVLLISPTVPKNRHYSFFPPISLGVIGTILKKKDNCDVKIIDNTRYKTYLLEDLLQIVRDYRPHMIGLTLMTPHVSLGYKIIQSLVQTHIPIVVGG